MLIKEMATDEKPRERLIKYGKEFISNEELLAIILKTGTKNESAKNIAAKILSEFKNVENLKNASVRKLTSIKGVGVVKSIELLASIELGKRVYGSLPEKNEKLNNSKLIFDKFKSLFEGEQQEIFYAIYLDTKQNLIDYKPLFKGTLNASTVHPREIFKEAFLLSASGIIIMHNHPSGDVIPSTPDIDVTSKVDAISKIMGINFIDHIIIGKNKYYSFYEESKNFVKN